MTTTPMQRAVTINLLKYAAGSRITCPTCNSILDWKRTVIISITAGDKHHEVIVCSPCWDKLKDTFTQRLSQVGASAEITDGRNFAKGAR